MKLATYETAGVRRIGVVLGAGDRVLDLAAAAAREAAPAPEFASMLAFLDAGRAALDRAARLVDARAGEPDLTRGLGEVRLLSPLPRPRQMRDFSVFPEHIVQAPVGMQKLAARMAGAPPPDVQRANDVPQAYRDRPIYYKGNRFSVAGHGADVLWPRYSRYMDYELELGCVIGRAGVNIAAAEAGAHIFGYTIFNDFSARDAQYLEMQGRLGPAKGKDFDTGNVLGPWIVTAEEIGDPYPLRMTARVNGEVWSEGTAAGMLHSFEDILAYVSADETVHPGEVFGSGTVGGGCGLELDRYLEHGDVVELEIEKIGVLRNRVLRRDV
jgi:2-keto-4-pentenoate hydratase/2-oxohepta-3-ene-1,7-dioic acid hydratase in catechol pathway